MSSFLVGANIVPPRPREQARYTIRELLILGLTLPIRFCPINKFGPEALALEIVSLERMNESLLAYEREQMRQWQVAHVQAKRRLIHAAKERGKRVEQSGGRVNHRNYSEHEEEEEMEGEGDRTLDDEMGGSRSVSSHMAYRHPSRQEALHFQIPSTHGGGPVNINIGLSLDYTTHPSAVRATLQDSSPSSGTSSGVGNSSQGTRYAWKKQQPQTSASLSTYLKDAPTPSKPSATESHSTKAESSKMEPVLQTTPQTTPPMSTTAPRSYGGDTPNSMAVERATEPSLRSYSPTSSIRGGASDADYNESPPSASLNFSSPSHSLNFVPPAEPSTPLTGSVATLVPFESPQGTLVDSPQKEKEMNAQSNEASDDFVVVSGTPSAAPSETAADRAGGSTSTSTVAVTPGPSGISKPFLSRGRLDAKAQDDFIAYMMRKK